MALFTTLYDLYLDEDSYCYSDLHKDVYGFRPRGYARYMAKAEFLHMLDGLHADLEAQIYDTNIRQLANQRRFELKIAEVIALGAGNRQTALQWLLDGEGEQATQYGMEYMQYTWDFAWHLTYEYTKELKAA